MPPTAGSGVGVGSPMVVRTGAEESHMYGVGEAANSWPALSRALTALDSGSMTNVRVGEARW